jgi:hypothetical protein
MIKPYQLFPILFLGLTFCSQKEQKENTAVTPLNLPSTTAPAQSSEALNPAHGQPNHRCDIAVGAPLSSPKQPNLVVPPTTTPLGQGATAAGTNPPHGQPGHDCSKPVGSPL